MAVDPGALSTPALLDLVDGKWASWAGLDPLPSAAAVAEQLGASLDATPIGGVFAGSPTMFRRYVTPRSSPPAIVWFEGDTAVAIQVDDARRAPGDGDLPTPDLELESSVGPSWRQLVYAGRGLILHVPQDGPIEHARLVIGLPPGTVEQFLDDPVRHLGGERRLG